MSAPQWKPGDVATFDVGNGERATAIRTSEGLWTAYAPGHERSWIDRPWDGRHDQRPLVVIDPEDLAEVERIMPPNWHRDKASLRWLQQHLRSLLAPPKPDEPQGLGAVVVCGGEVYVRVNNRKRPWQHEEDGNRLAWDELDRSISVMHHGVEQLADWERELLREGLST